MFCNRRSFARFLLTVALVCLVAAHVASGEEPKTKNETIAGTWVGTLNTGAVKLRIVVELKKNDAGEWSGSLDSPDQGAFGIPIESASLVDGKVRFQSKQVGGTFDGKLSADGKEITGEWKQGGGTLPLVLKPGDKAPPPARPQTPKPPFPYDEEPVTYRNAKAGITLAGTLTRPRGDKPSPAVLLITGSGAQNRDEELLGHKPFWVLADHLTRLGVAVLRVDDRGVGGSTGDFAKATSADFVQDVLAGVEFLKTRRDVDAKRIGLIGHSEGGLIAPAVAVQSPDVSFIVLLAGTGVTGEEILYRQGDLIAEAMGVPLLGRIINREVQRQMFAVVKAEPDDKLATEKIQAALSNPSDKPADEAKPPPLPPALQAQLKAVLSPWFRYFLTYDPRPALEKVRCPVLAINGERDLQVDPKQNLPVIEAALQAGGNQDFTVRELPALNHLFQSCKTGSLSEYITIEETINPAALKIVGDWIVERFVTK